MLTGPAIYWAIVKLAIVLAATGVLAYVGTSFLMAFALLSPTRMGAGRAMYFLHRLSPSDINLPYESIRFRVRDDRTGRPLHLAAWWIDCDRPSERCAVILHGYSDAKVGGIAWAPLLRSYGFNILAVDLRAHGESEGKYSTAAFFERHDIGQVLDQIKISRPTQTRQILLFGVSLGAAVAAAVAAMRNDLSAVVLESPYVDFPHAVLNHAANLPLPGRRFQRLAIWFCQRIAHIDYSAVRPIDMIPKIHCPLWIVQSGDDPFVTEAENKAIEETARKRAANLGFTDVWHVPECHHVIALSEHPEEFARRLAEFLEAALAVSAPAK
ncbi:MAG TPA: alpha/beta hydrolase [Tepidisphaeraceae bacterium]|nr:alpha/beta hydrolase [Tepidisphaeraceae bacterium]